MPERRCRVAKAPTPRKLTRNSFNAMHARCLTPAHEAWCHYGGRGITICERWLHNFDAFLEDMGERPSQEYTLDRKDGDKGYSKSNCKWSTWAEQAENRARTKITYAGLTLDIGEWADYLNLTA